MFELPTNRHIMARLTTAVEPQMTLSTHSFSKKKYSSYFHNKFAFHLQTATYDVQRLLVTGDEDGVKVTGEFISDIQASGCLLVFVGTSPSPDIFRALQRPHLELGYTVRVPSSTYTVYGYDIERDKLPNTIPAVALDRQTTFTHSTG